MYDEAEAELMLADRLVMLGMLEQENGMNQVQKSGEIVAELITVSAAQRLISLSCI